MERFPYVDCIGLAGAWSLGTVQTGGFELVHRASLKGGFGDASVDRNRHLLGKDWEQDEGGDSSEWSPVDGVAYLNGTPPCSGFSLLNNTAAAARKAGKTEPITKRGIDSAINECMRELVRYAGKSVGSDGLPGPQVVSFESVQGAGKEGRPLMQALRDMLSADTGQQYGLSHVFMSGSSIGAPQFRHRYFVIFHRIAFGVDPIKPRRVATYRDAIGDLQGHLLTWDAQPYRQPAIDPLFDAWWVKEQGIRKGAGKTVDAHAAYGDENDKARTPRIYLEDLLPYFTEGGNDEVPLQKFLADNGRLPAGAEGWWDWENNRKKGFSSPRMIVPDRPGYVLTGGGLADFFHWAEPRYLTVRETARLMGYPDTWSWDSASGLNQASAWIGKCCPVTSGRWISQRILHALRGEAEEPLTQIGEREGYFNCTLDYKRWPREISRLSQTVK
jgi:site-specific DNA-cytosine methylase